MNMFFSVPRPIKLLYTGVLKLICGDSFIIFLMKRGEIVIFSVTNNSLSFFQCTNSSNLLSTLVAHSSDTKALLRPPSHVSQKLSFIASSWTRYAPFFVASFCLLSFTPWDPLPRGSNLPFTDLCLAWDICNLAKCGSTPPLRVAVIYIEPN